MPVAHLRHRPGRHRRPRRWSCTGTAWDPAAIGLPVGGFYKSRRARREPRLRGADDPHAAGGVRRGAYETYQRFCRAMKALPTDPAARPAGLASRRHRPVPLEEVESDHRDPQALRDARHELGALGPEAHETLNIAMNRIGAKSDSGEGGEDPARYQPRAERRQPQLGDQAGGVGPLRRDGGISEPVPRDRDQDRPGREARRGRPAARLQGDRADRAAAARRRRA